MSEEMISACLIDRLKGKASLYDSPRAVHMEVTQSARNLLFMQDCLLYFKVHPSLSFGKYGISTG